MDTPSLEKIKADCTRLFEEVTASLKSQDQEISQEKYIGFVKSLAELQTQLFREATRCVFYEGKGEIQELYRQFKKTRRISRYLENLQKQHSSTLSTKEMAQDVERIYEQRHEGFFKVLNILEFKLENLKTDEESFNRTHYQVWLKFWLPEEKSEDHKNLYVLESRIQSLAFPSVHDLVVSKIEQLVEDFEDAKYHKSSPQNHHEISQSEDHHQSASSLSSQDVVFTEIDPSVKTQKSQSSLQDHHEISQSEDHHQSASSLLKKIINYIQSFFPRKETYTPLSAQHATTLKSPIESNGNTQPSSLSQKKAISLSDNFIQKVFTSSTKNKKNTNPGTSHVCPTCNNSEKSNRV